MQIQIISVIVLENYFIDGMLQILNLDMHVIILTKFFFWI